MKPERKLWHDLKKNTQDITWNRIENLVGLGLPDLLGYNSSHRYFTVELKIASGNKVRLSPHQISYHVQHPVNSYILIRKDKQLMLVTGAEIMELADKGFGSCSIVADSWTTIQRVLSP